MTAPLTIGGHRTALDDAVRELVRRDGISSASDLNDSDYQRLSTMALAEDGVSAVLGYGLDQMDEGAEERITKHFDHAHHIGLRDERMRLLGEEVHRLMSRITRATLDAVFETEAEAWDAHLAREMESDRLANEADRRYDEERMA